MSDWISTNEKLPEMYVDVLVFYDGLMNVCRLAHGIMGFKVWEDNNGFYIDGVTHWMPLPKRPKENNNADM